LPPKDKDVTLYLSELRLNNFKGFHSAAAIPLAPLTLLFGANSSGKSTILKALQVISSLCTSPSGLVPWDSEQLQLVSQRYASHRHAGGVSQFGISLTETHQEEPLPFPTRRTISLDVQLQGDEMSVGCNFPGVGTLSLRRLGSPKIDSGSLWNTGLTRYRAGLHDSLAFLEAVYGWKRPTEPYSYLKNEWLKEVQKKTAELRPHDAHSAQIPIAQGFRLALQRIDPRSSSSDTTADDTEKTGAAVLALFQLLNLSLDFWSPSFPEFSLSSPSARGPQLREALRGQIQAIFDSFPGFASRRGTVGELEVKALQEQLEEFFFNVLMWIDPVNSHQASGGRVGLGSIQKLLGDAVFLGPSRDVQGHFDLRPSSVSRYPQSTHGSDEVDTLFDTARINRSLEMLELDYSVLLANIDSHSVPWLDDSLVLTLHDREGIPLSVKDVGYGVGQVLPILIELSRASLLLVEQPELHLHPRLQANLVEMAVEQVSNHGKQVVFETHSEHMIHRLSRLIRTGMVDPDDVCLVAVAGPIDEVGPLPYRVEFDADGNLLHPWPPGFFYDEIDDILG